MKHSTIRTLLGNIRRFHNVIASWNILEYFRIFFIDAKGAQYTMNKMEKEGIPTLAVLPVNTSKIKGCTIILKEIPLGTTKKAIKTTIKEYGSIEKIS